MWRNGKEENIRRNGNEQQREVTHQGSIASPSVVPSESSIHESVDNKKTEKESVDMKEDKESMNMKEDKENRNKEDKESVNIKDEKKKKKTSLKSRLKGNVLFRFK